MGLVSVNSQEAKWYAKKMSTYLSDTTKQPTTDRVLDCEQSISQDVTDEPSEALCG